jgi:hypothetical protein
MRNLNADYTIFQQNLDDVKDNVRFARAGEIIQIVDASAPSATIAVKLNSIDAPAFRMRLGDIIALPFERFWYSSNAQTNQWIKILISSDKSYRFYSSDYATSFDGAPRLIANVSVTATLSSVISPSKEVSQFVLINDCASSYPLHIGDSLLAPSATKLGDIILPTERRIFRGVNSSFKIYARCKTGESATLGVVEYD